MSDTVIHTDGFDANDSRSELFPDIGSCKWIAQEKGINKFLRADPCMTCGHNIYTVYPSKTRKNGQVKCWHCKKEEPKRNHSTTASNRAKYRARKKDAIPESLTNDEWLRIKEIYAHRDHLNKTTNTQWHVDHIIPLNKGGKHHPDNLQVITAKENLKKSDKMPYFLGPNPSFQPASTQY
jgi:5-methylcytosine-specific restriction endonuclease McrA